MAIVQKYINLYLHKLTTKIALWQRYISSQLFLGVSEEVAWFWLADALRDGDIYETN
jgi:hypothetical protein